MYKKGFIAVPVILVMFAVGFFLTEEDSIDSKNTVTPIKVASIKTTTPELKAKEIKSQKKHAQTVNVSEDLDQIAEAKFEIIEPITYPPVLAEAFSDLQKRANEGDICPTIIKSTVVPLAFKSNIACTACSAPFS